MPRSVVLVGENDRLTSKLGEAASSQPLRRQSMRQRLKSVIAYQRALRRRRLASLSTSMSLWPELAKMWPLKARHGMGNI